MGLVCLRVQIKNLLIAFEDVHHGRAEHRKHRNIPFNILSIHVCQWELIVQSGGRERLPNYLDANVYNHTDRDHREGKHNKAEEADVAKTSLEDNWEQHESAGRRIPMRVATFAHVESLAHQLVNL